MQCEQRPTVAQRMIVTAWLVCCFALAGLNAEAASGDGRPTLTLTCLSQSNQLGFQYFESINRKIFDEMGYNLKLEHDNHSEVLRRLQSGEIDGDCGRHNDFIELTGIDTLIKAKHPFRVVSFNLWQNPKVPVNRARSSLTAGYNNDLPFIGAHLERIKFQQLTGYPSDAKLIEALITGTLDAIVNFDTAMEPFQKTLKQHNIVNKGAILSVPIYTLLHKRHEHLIDEYSERLKKALATKPFKPPFSARIPKQHPNEIVFSCSIPEDSKTFSQIEKIYRMAFDNLGFKFRLISLPRVRESAELKRQNISGSCGRGISFLTDDVTAVTVEVKVAMPDISIWSRTPGNQFRSIEDIPSGSRVTYVRGTSTIERSPMITDQTSITLIGVANTAVGIRMLDAKRIDYHLESELNTRHILKNMPTQHSIYSAGAISGEMITPLLTEQWKHLAQPLKQELTRLMKVNGVDQLIDIH